MEKSGKLQTSSVSKVIVFCVTPIVLGNFMIVSSIKSMSWWAEKKQLQVASSNGACVSLNLFKKLKNNIKNHKQTISKCDSIFGINKPNLLFVNGNFETCNLSNAKNMQKPFHCSVLQIWQRFSTWRFQRHLHQHLAEASEPEEPCKDSLPNKNDSLSWL